MTTIKSKLNEALLVSVILTYGVAAGQDTAFTYQGKLSSANSPATGMFDLIFRLALDPNGSSYAGSPVVAGGLQVTDGLFSTAIDFGPGLFNGTQYWLEVDVRAHGATDFTAMSPLQPLSQVPYAVMANSASNLLGTLPASQVVGSLPSSQLSGTMPDASLSGNVALRAGGNIFTGPQIVAGTLAINTYSAPENDFSINSDTYLFSHALFLRGETGMDHNHGLAYNGSTFTNFSGGNFQVDGPALWGYSGGVLGTRVGGDKGALSWYSGGVVVYGQAYVTGALTADTGSLGSLAVSGAVKAADITLSGNVAAANATISSDITGGGNLTVQKDIIGGGVLNLSGSGAIGGPLAVGGAIRASGDVYARGIKLTSDRNAKENFTHVKPTEVLAKVAALPLSEWSYLGDQEHQRHLGPMAQDFQAAFGLNGQDDTHISVVDESGVALAAIQGLNEKIDQKDAEIQALRKQVEDLASTVRALAGKR